MKDFFTSYLGELLTVIIAGFGGWFFGRKKQAVEIQSTEIDNGAKAVNLYKETLDDLGVRYEQKYKDVVALYESREKLLRDEIIMLKNKIKMLRQENISLKKRSGELEKQLKNEDNRP
jgi:hypothetical protein